MTKAGFFTRMANEATRTLSDAYGHVMHGDDAGSSAKVVWVVHPTNVPISGGGGGDDNYNGGGGKEEEKSNTKKKGNPQSPGSHKNSNNSNNNNNSGDDYLYTQKFGKLYVMFDIYVCNIFINMAYNHYIACCHYQLNHTINTHNYTTIINYTSTSTL